MRNMCWCTGNANGGENNPNQPANTPTLRKSDLNQPNFFSNFLNMPVTPLQRPVLHSNMPCGSLFGAYIRCRHLRLGGPVVLLVDGVFVRLRRWRWWRRRRTIELIRGVTLSSAAPWRTAAAAAAGDAAATRPGVPGAAQPGSPRRCKHSWPRYGPAGWAVGMVARARGQGGGVEGSGVGAPVEAALRRRPGTQSSGTGAGRAAARGTATATAGTAGGSGHGGDGRAGELRRRGRGQKVLRRGKGGGQRARADGAAVPRGRDEARAEWRHGVVREGRMQRVQAAVLGRRRLLLCRTCSGAAGAAGL